MLSMGVRTTKSLSNVRSTGAGNTCMYCNLRILSTKRCNQFFSKNWECIDDVLYNPGRKMSTTSIYIITWDSSNQYFELVHTFK